MSDKTEREALEHKIAVNMGLYYRESDGKWLREINDLNGKFLRLEDMTSEVKSVVSIFQAEITKVLEGLEREADDYIWDDAIVQAVPLQAIQAAGKEQS